MITSYATGLKDNAAFFFEKLSHEKALRRIILDNCTKENDYNAIWINRWETYRVALYPHFWENHFHIPTILNSKALTGKVLDFGCGSGHIDFILAKNGLDIHGIDLSTTAIDIANYFRSHQTQAVQKRLHFTATDIKDFDPAFKFDSCLMTDILEHLPLEIAIEIVNHLRRLLTEDAKIFVSLPFEKYYNHPTRCNFFYSLEEFRTFCTAIGLKVTHAQVDEKNHTIDAVVSIVQKEEAFDLNYPPEIMQVRQ